jgi:hypothetical protein
MKRSLLFAGALALAAVQPAVTLAAPRGGQAPARPPASTSHAAARAGSAGASANLDDFKVPFRVDAQPKSLSQHFALASRAASLPQALLPAYRRFGLQPAPGYLWSPAMYGPSCYASNTFMGSASEPQQSSGYTLGSLVDGKSNVLSPLSYDGFSRGNAPNTASSSTLTLQSGFSATPCGTPTFTNF